MIEITAVAENEGDVILVLNIENCKTPGELPVSYTNFEHIYFTGEGITYCDDVFEENLLLIGCKYKVEDFKKRVNIVSMMEKRLKLINEWLNIRGYKMKELSFYEECKLNAIKHLKELDAKGEDVTDEEFIARYNLRCYLNGDRI